MVSWLVIPPIVAIISNAAIVWFMLRRGVKTSHPSFIWLLFVLLFFTWIASDLAFRWLEVQPTALYALVPAYFFADFSPCLFVLFALSYTRGFHALERAHLWIVGVITLPMLSSFVRSAIAVANYVPPPDVCVVYNGSCSFQETSIRILGPESYYFGVLLTLGLYAVGALLLLFPPPEKRTPAYRREIRYIGGGVLLLMGIGLPSDIIVPALGGPNLGLSSVAITVMNFTISLGITRRGVLLFAPTTERVQGVEEGEARLKLQEGRVYVLRRKGALDAFKRMVNEGYEGVYVGVGEPDPEVAGTFKRIPIIMIERAGWGVREEGNIRYVPSTNLRGLSDSILHYARTTRKGIIYLDLIDQIFDDGWITAKAALEIGSELGQPRVGIPKITWLYSMKDPAEESVELRGLFDMPIVKKAVLVYLFNLILERSGQGPNEAQRRLHTLQGVDPFFKEVRHHTDGVTLEPEIDRDVDLLTTDITNKVRIFLKQFEDRMPAPARTEVLKRIAAMGLSPYAFIVRGGDAYLLEESAASRGRGYEILKELVRHGYLGLCISRTEPTKLAEKYAFEPGTLVYWLTAERRGEKDLRPAPEYLVNQVKSFVDEVGQRNGVVLLDGLEFLVTYSGDQFEPYLKALRRIADLVAQSRTVFIVVYDVEVFPAERVALIRRSGFDLLPALPA